MPWFIIALCAPILSSIGNYTDKYLVSHPRKTGGIGSILIFSSLFGSLVLPIAYTLGALPTSVPVIYALILMVNGALTVATLGAYLYAIRDSDVVSVVPVLQLIPIIGFIFGWVMLGETLSASQILGSSIIVLSAILLSLEIEEDARLRFRARSFAYASLSALLFVISGVIFKSTASVVGYWDAQFWEYIGITFVGVVLAASVPSYRQGFVRVVSERRIGVVGLNLVTEGLMVSSDLLLNYATLLAPVALVYSVNALQPAFLFVFALIGAVMAPGLMARMSLLRKHMALKLISICLMTAGAFIMYLY